MKSILDYDVKQFIPQRSPMVMIDQLLEVEDSFIKTLFLVLQANVFISNGKLGEPGLVENIAQTAAAYVGYTCFQNNVPVPIGYIAAIKELDIYDLPPVGASLVTEVRVLNKIMDFSMVKGEVRLGEKLLCSCEMRIMAKT